MAKSTATLTPLQERFVEEYLVDLNQTQAARRAGYSAGSASQSAYKNMRRPCVMAEIERRLGTPGDATRARVVEELTAIAFADAADFFAWGPDGLSVKASEGLDRRLTRAVAEVTESRTSAGGSIRVKLADKLAALEKLARALGMFREQPVETAGGATPMPPDRRELAKAVLAILASGDGTDRPAAAPDVDDGSAT